MLDSTIYIIRNGEFGSDFESKFYTTLFCLLVTLFIWWKWKNKDYFWVFIIGTILWSIAEFSVQFMGLRQFNAVTLFGVPIPLAIIAILRGAAEGGAVVLFGLGVGDLLAKKATQIYGFLFLGASLLWLVISTLTNAFPTKMIGGEVASRRDIFSLSSLFVTILVTVLSAYWLSRVSQPVRQRALRLFWVMVIMSGVWTLTQVVADLRWVEVFTAGAYMRAPFWVEFGTLFYDVVFEIGFMYIPFFAIPFMLKLLKHNE